MESKLEILLEEEYRQLEYLQKELAELDGGTLNKRVRNGRYYFMERLAGKQRGITGMQERIYDLARKGFLNKKIEINGSSIGITEKALTAIKQSNGRKKLQMYIDDLKMLDIERVIYSPEQRKWRADRQSKNPYMRDALYYCTNEGVLMRSKSERFIGNFLETKELIYMYEPQIVIRGVPIYPDFMILCRSGRVVIWEHCGLMDDKEYFHKTMEKIHKYRECGYVLHENLICTYEEDLVSVENLEKIYRRFLTD